MNPVLTWANDWLILNCGPWSIRVGFIEVYSDKTANAFLYSWKADPNDAWIAVPESDPAPRLREDYGSVEIPCSSESEAVAVIRALLGVRGIRDIPDKTS